MEAVEIAEVRVRFMRTFLKIEFLCILTAATVQAAPNFGSFCASCENPNRTASAQTSPALAALASNGMAGELQHLSLGYSVRSLEQLQAEGLSPKAPLLPTWEQMRPAYNPSFAGVTESVPDFGQSQAPITPNVSELTKHFDPWVKPAAWVDLLNPTFQTPFNDHAGLVAYLNTNAPWMYGSYGASDSFGNPYGIAGVGGFSAY